MRPLTKNGDNEQYTLVQPIVAIFAECSTRHSSDKKFISLIDVCRDNVKIERIGKLGNLVSN